MTGAWDEELVTVKEIAEHLKINQQTVRNWIDQGQLPAVRIGRRVRIRRTDIDQLINQGSTNRPPAGNAVSPEPLPAVSPEVRVQLTEAVERARRLLGRVGGVRRADLAEGLQELAQAVEAALRQRD